MAKKNKNSTKVKIYTNISLNKKLKKTNKKSIQKQKNLTRKRVRIYYNFKVTRIEKGTF